MGCSEMGAMKEKMLEDIPGVGRIMAEKLRAGGYNDLGKLARASPPDVADLCGIKDTRAADFIIAAQKILGREEISPCDKNNLWADPDIRISNLEKRVLELSEMVQNQKIMISGLNDNVMRIRKSMIVNASMYPIGFVSLEGPFAFDRKSKNPCHLCNKCVEKGEMAYIPKFINRESLKENDEIIVEYGVFHQRCVDSVFGSLYSSMSQREYKTRRRC